MWEGVGGGEEERERKEEREREGREREGRVRTKKKRTALANMRVDNDALRVTDHVPVVDVRHDRDALRVTFFLCGLPSQALFCVFLLVHASGFSDSS